MWIRGKWVESLIDDLGQIAPKKEYTLIGTVKKSIALDGILNGIHQFIFPHECIADQNRIHESEKMSEIHES